MPGSFKSLSCSISFIQAARLLWLPCFDVTISLFFEPGPQYFSLDSVNLMYSYILIELLLD